VFEARYVELVQCSPTRHIWDFNTDQPPVTELEQLSQTLPKLTFLLDYEDERRRIKGLAKAKGGTAVHHQFRY
jgi:hypothetical protein